MLKFLLKYNKSINRLLKIKNIIRKIMKYKLNDMRLS